ASALDELKTSTWAVRRADLIGGPGKAHGPQISFQNRLDRSQQSAMTAEGSRCSVCQCPFPAGNHYGAVTCHACKSFFKRTVQLSLSYNCMRRPRHCSLSSERSRSCGFCRFKKCLEVGMRPALVRSLAPDTGIGHACQTPVAGVQQPPLPPQQGFHQRLLPKPSGSGIPADQPVRDQPQAETGNADDTPDLEAVQVDLSGGPAGQDGPDMTELMSRGIWLLVESYLGALVRWAKRLPGFDGILDDRVALLQQHWLDVIVLQVRSPLAVVAWNSHPYTGWLNFCSGFSLHERQEPLIRQVPAISRHTRVLAQRLSLLDLRHAELLQLRAIIFLETGCSAGYADPDRIDTLQRRHILALALACPCPVRRAKILQLSGAVTAGRLHALAYFDRVLNLEGQVPPPLAGEALRNSFSSA
uniref:Nuclear receptor domain-containing protein n=1 Tax=Macrostomum lignano TaxID=282301 RepID=A0A1I8J483_9PLAT